MLKDLMENKNVNPDLFELSIKINKLDSIIINYIAISLNIDINNSKENIILEILKQMKTLSKEELQKYISILDKEIKDQDIKDIKINNSINMKTKLKKRKYKQNPN